MKKIHSYNTNNATIHNGGEKEMEVLPFILNHGTRILKSWLQLKKNHGNEEKELEIYFMDYGFQICLWKE